MRKKTEKSELKTDDSVPLDKVDIVRERMPVGYQEALRALEEAQGDLVRALALIEQWLKEKEEEASLNRLIEDVLEEIQQATKSPIRKIRLCLGKGWSKEFPVMLTAGAAVVATVAAFLVNRCQVEVEHEKPEGEVEG
jgi:hypothetical protein